MTGNHDRPRVRGYTDVSRALRREIERTANRGPTPREAALAKAASRQKQAKTEHEAAWRAHDIFLAGEADA